MLQETMTTNMNPLNVIIDDESSILEIKHFNSKGQLMNQSGSIAYTNTSKGDKNVHIVDDFSSLAGLSNFKDESPYPVLEDQSNVTENKLIDLIVSSADKKQVGYMPPSLKQSIGQKPAYKPKKVFGAKKVSTNFNFSGKKHSLMTKDLALKQNQNIAQNQNRLVTFGNSSQANSQSQQSEMERDSQGLIL